MTTGGHKLNCGVIGVGRLGYRHAASVVRNPRAKLLAVADPMAEARAKAESDFGSISVHDDYRRVLDNKDIEAVVIATPTQQHYAILVDAVRAGKKIFVEKPITYTLEEAENICALASKAGTFLQVAFMRRFDPGHTAAKRMIEAGEIGDPLYINDIQRDPHGPPKHYVPQSGGIFVDMAIHNLDCVRWLMGKEIASVYAHGAVLKYDYLKEMDDVDEGDMLVTFENGTLGHVEVSRNASEIYDIRTEVVGSKGSVYIGEAQHTPFIKVSGAGLTYDVASWCLGRFEKAYELEVDAFVDAVLNDKPSPVSAQDGMIALKLAKAATASKKSSKAIQIDAFKG
jgi:scyllo-inositol 2-dehydrogenase (NAD+)